MEITPCVRGAEPEGDRGAANWKLQAPACGRRRGGHRQWITGVSVSRHCQGLRRKPVIVTDEGGRGLLHVNRIDGGKRRERGEHPQDRNDNESLRVLQAGPSVRCSHLIALGHCWLPRSAALARHQGRRWMKTRRRDTRPWSAKSSAPVSRRE